MQKITPFLWFNTQAEEAINYYTSIFNNSKVASIKRYPDGPLEGLMKGMEGRVLTGVFELEGQRFMALDGGPFFTFTPAASLTVACESAARVDELYAKLVEGGTVLMPLQKYPFSERYAWLNDRYGVSWQLNAVKNEQVIIPSLMFVGEQFGKAEEAINFYTSIFKNSSITTIARYEKGEGDVEGKIKYALYKLAGQEFISMESSLEHKFSSSGAISLYVECETQEEVDYFWEKLTAGGNPQAQQCGWLQDRYGFSWQIIPTALPRLLSDPDKAKADRVMQAMLKMKKIDVQTLERA